MKSEININGFIVTFDSVRPLDLVTISDRMIGTYFKSINFLVETTSLSCHYFIQVFSQFQGLEWNHQKNYVEKLYSAKTTQLNIQLEYVFK